MRILMPCVVVGASGFQQRPFFFSGRSLNGLPSEYNPMVLIHQRRLQMSLKSLAFTVLPNNERTPLDSRRAKTIERLQEQKQLLQDPSYVRTSKKWVTVNGQKELVDKRQRVLPWWR